MEMEVISAFDKSAEDYDSWYHKEPGSLIFESEVRAVEVFPLMGLGVEIGVGTGVFSSRLKVPLGLDPSLRMLRIARRRGLSVVQGLGEFLPIKSRSLDYVLFILTICFLRNPSISFREAWRILKNEGHIIIGFIPRNSQWGELYSKKGGEGHSIYRYARFYTLDEVEEMLRAVGFKVQEYSATLYQGPKELAEVETPSNNVKRQGFICVKAEKIASFSSC